MAIRGIVFDIGGVLEYNPRLNFDEKWEKRLNLQPGEVNQRLYDVWVKSSTGTITEVEAACAFGMHGILFKDNQQAITDIQACSAAQPE